MGRDTRRDNEGAWHHVMNQGTAKADIFREVGDRHYFNGLLGHLRPRFGLEVHAYSQLGNHYHLLLRSTEGRLSEGMQWLGARYARWFNVRHGRVGAFFRGRFTSKIVEDERYLAWLPIYIHLNPVHDGFAERPEAWRWSSYGGIVGLSARDRWLQTGVVGAGMRREEYRELTESYVRRTPLSASTPQLVTESWSREQSERRASDIERLVADEFGMTVEQLWCPKSHRNPARTTAIALVACGSGLGRCEIASRYRLRSAQAVSNAVRRAQELLASDERAASASAAIASF